MTEAHLDRIFTALAAGQVRYLVVGGLAVVAHGHARLTADLDLVIALDPENIRRALHALATLGYRPSAPVRAEDFINPKERYRWTVEKGMQVLQLISDVQPETGIDIFVQEPFDFDAEYASAPQMELVEGKQIPVVRLGTLLAMKRRVARPRDLEDLRQLEQLRDAGSPDAAGESPI